MQAVNETLPEYCINDEYPCPTYFQLTSYWTTSVVLTSISVAVSLRTCYKYKSNPQFQPTHIKVFFPQIVFNLAFSLIYLVAHTRNLYNYHTYGTTMQDDAFCHFSVLASYISQFGLCLAPIPVAYLPYKMTENVRRNLTLPPAQRKKAEEGIFSKNFFRNFFVFIFLLGTVSYFPSEFTDGISTVNGFYCGLRSYAAPSSIPVVIVVFVGISLSLVLYYKTYKNLQGFLNLVAPSKVTPSTDSDKVTKSHNRNKTTVARVSFAVLKSSMIIMVFLIILLSGINMLLVLNIFNLKLTVGVVLWAGLSLKIKPIVDVMVVNMLVRKKNLGVMSSHNPTHNQSIVSTPLEESIAVTSSLQHRAALQETGDLSVDTRVVPQ